MHFKMNANTKAVYSGDRPAIKNAVDILNRDIAKKFTLPGGDANRIVLRQDGALGSERFVIDVSESVTVRASDELGFVYGLLYISGQFLGIEPFWFWMDQRIAKTDAVGIGYGQYRSKAPAVKYRGWFVNDEVLIMKWDINGDSAEPWRMVFEALLRCGGNMVIPGTDKNSKKYRQLASDMGLWITHHHAEPLGAEMFTRVYPDMEPNYTETPELFHKLWEEALLKLAKMIADEAGAGYIPHPKGTEIIRRRGADDSRYTMLLNYTAEKADTGIAGRSLLSGEPFGGTLEGYGVEIIDTNEVK